MKVEITEKGVYDAKGQAVPVGTVLTIKGDDLPASLVNKCRVVSAPVEAKVAITNPAKGDDTQAGGGA